jgi:hypothetical protein
MFCSTCTGFALSLAITAASPAGHADQPDSAIRDVERAVASLSLASPTCEDARRGLVAILDAVDRACQAGDESQQACGARVAVARLRLAHGSLLDEAAVDLIQDCYRALHHGESFEAPGGIRSTADATAFIVDRLDLARGLLAGARSREAVDALLDAALMAVTPVRR